MASNSVLSTKAHNEDQMFIDSMIELPGSGESCSLLPCLLSDHSLSSDLDQGPCHQPTSLAVE